MASVVFAILAKDGASRSRLRLVSHDAMQRAKDTLARELRTAEPTRCYSKSGRDAMVHLLN